MNQKISTGLGTAILLVMAFTAGYFLWVIEKNDTEESVHYQSAIINSRIQETVKENDRSILNENIEIKNTLFFASNKATEFDEITVSTFNTKNNTVLKSRTVKLNDSLGFSTHGASGANYAVQFNHQTGDVLYLTTGSSAYDGSCINKDGTCFDRIYKFNIDEKEQRPRVIFQTDGSIQSWIVNPMENIIIAGIHTYDEAGNYIFVIRSIDISSGATKVITEAASAGVGLVLSSDGKYIFQVVEGDKLFLNQIDIASGSIEKVDVYNGRISLSEGFVAPNGRYVAFHQSGLKIFDVVGDKMISHGYLGKIGNYTLVWSADSKKVAYMLDDKLVYYDIEKDRDAIIESEAGYIYHWNPSNRYIMYTLTKRNVGVKFYDTFEDKNVEFNQDIFKDATPYSIVGVNWF